MSTITKETLQKFEEPIENTLSLLVLNHSYKGFRYLICGIGLAMEKPEILTYICKGVYWEIAGRFGTTYSCVERDIRTARETILRNGSEALRIQVFGEKYRNSLPKNAEFIDCLARYLKQQTR